MKPVPLTSVVIGMYFVVQAGTGCDPVSPPGGARTPHDFTWTRDTIGDGSYQFSANDVWGASETDVFLVGHSSDFGRWKTWHFNGTRWSDITSVYFETFPGPPWYWHYPLALTGFSSGDAWIAGRYDSTEVMGQAYRGYVQHRKPTGQWEGFRIPGALSLFAIGGNSSTDLWVGGLFGQSFHYDGTNWTEHRIADSAMIVIIRAAPDGTVYASGWGKEGSGIEVQYFRWSGSQWEKIEERMTQNGGSGPGAGISFDVLDDGRLYSASGAYIAQRVTANSWMTLIEDPAARFHYSMNSGPFGFALGRTTEERELVYLHAQGSWKRLSGVSSLNSRVFRVWSSSSATFLVAEQNSPSGSLFPKSIVLRGN